MTRISGRWAGIGVISLALVAATVLTLGDVRLASSQTVTLVAERSELAIPLDDPFDRVWNRSTPVEVPLSAQILTPPKAGGDHTVTARALHDEQRLYLLIEWQDDSQDLLLSRQTEFTDAAAVQFPVSAGQTVPAFCMGDPNAPVNIWQWKAAWQSDIEQGFVDVQDTYPNMAVDLYPFEDEDVFYPARALGNVFAQSDRSTSVDNLLAGSFGTLTQADDQIVQGNGQWQDGRWRVLFARDLAVDGDYSQFAQGDRSAVAFAVWNGSSNERDGMKSVSQFLTLEVSSAAARADGDGFEVWIIVGALAGLTALATIVTVANYYRRQGA